MKYRGKDSNLIECHSFIINECVVKKTPVKNYDFIEICIYTKVEHEKVASITGFLYDYNLQCSCGDTMDALHIKSLGTNKKYLRRGFATYLMKEAIKYGELKKVKHITVNPCASTYIISQNDLMSFYKKFSFYHKKFLFKEEIDIEFMTILD